MILIIRFDDEHKETHYNVGRIDTLDQTIELYYYDNKPKVYLKREEIVEMKVVSL